MKYTTDLVPHPFPGPILPPFFSCFLHTIGGNSSAELLSPASLVVLRIQPKALLLLFKH